MERQTEHPPIIFPAYVWHNGLFQKHILLYDSFPTK
jgi:hypothetical protein